MVVSFKKVWREIPSRFKNSTKITRTSLEDRHKFVTTPATSVIMVCVDSNVYRSALLLHAIYMTRD
jgi:hypothetical protein